MSCYRCQFVLESLIVKWILIMLFLTLVSGQKQFVIPVALQDVKQSQLSKFSISNNIQQLPVKQKKYRNKFITKQIEISSSETFRYSSSVLSPIFVLEKDACHTHEGTIQINKLEDVYYHDSYSTANSNYEKNGNDEKNGNNNQHINKKQRSTEKPSQIQSFSQQSSWIYNKKHQILYKISSSLKISAYKISQNSINKKIQSLYANSQILNSIEQQQTSGQKAIKHIASVDLFETMQKQNFIQQCSEQADALPILSKDQQKLYLFTCNAIYMVECHSVLAKIQTLFSFSNSINHQKNNNNQKESLQLFYGIEVKTVNQYIFWLSQTQGVRIYGVTLEGKLQYVETLKVPPNNFSSKNKSTPIKQSRQQPPKLSSLQYRNGLLYVLTLNHGVYIYDRLSAFHFQLVNYLEYLPEITKANKEIILYEGGMLIWSQSKSWQFVTEINIDTHSNQNQSNFNINIKQKDFLSKSSPPYTLNRYFKGYKSISEIKLFINNKLTKNNSALLIVSQKGIEIFPLQKDPREVSMMMNGVVNNHIGSDIRNVQEISHGVFIFEAFKENVEEVVEGEEETNNEREQQKPKQVQEDFLSYQSSSSVETYVVFLKVKYPEIECKFEKQGEYTILVQQQYQGQTASYTFQESTTQTTNHLPFSSPSATYHYQPHYYHELKITVKSQLLIEFITLWISILSVGILLSVVVMLIYWRENKLTFIDQIVYQIRKIQQSKLKNVEFQESSPQKAIQRKWQELMEEVEGDVQYKHGTQQGWNNQLMSERNYFKEQEENKNQVILNDPVCESIPPTRSKRQSTPFQQKQNKKINTLPHQSLQNTVQKRPDRPTYSKQDHIQMTDQMQKSLKQDLQVSHQDIVIQSPSVDKKIEPFAESYEETEFEELNFPSSQEEQNIQKQINLSVLDRHVDDDQKEKIKLIQDH